MIVMDDAGGFGDGLKQGKISAKHGSLKHAMHEEALR